MSLGLGHAGHAVARLIALDQNKKKISGGEAFQSQPRPNEGHRADVARNIEKSRHMLSIYGHGEALLVSSLGMLRRLIRWM
jgi:hypothetical protein